MSFIAAGLMNNIFGLDAKADMKPDELFDYLLANIGSCEAKDDKEEYLIKMISRYEPLETYDDQMKELFAWGETETDKWQVKTSRG